MQMILRSHEVDLTELSRAFALPTQGIMSDNVTIERSSLDGTVVLPMLNTLYSVILRILLYVRSILNICIIHKCVQSDRFSIKRNRQSYKSSIL